MDLKAPQELKVVLIRDLSGGLPLLVAQMNRPPTAEEIEGFQMTQWCHWALIVVLFYFFISILYIYVYLYI